MELDKLNKFIAAVISHVKAGAKAEGYKIEGSIYFDEVLVWDPYRTHHKIRFEVSESPKEEV